MQVVGFTFVAQNLTSISDWPDDRSMIQQRQPSLSENSTPMEDEPWRYGQTCGAEGVVGLTFCRSPSPGSSATPDDGRQPSQGFESAVVASVGCQRLTPQS
jgi:hypothetical protein